LRKKDIGKRHENHLTWQPEITSCERPVLALPRQPFQLQVILSGLKSVAAHCRREAHAQQSHIRDELRGTQRQAGNVGELLRADGEVILLKANLSLPRSFLRAKTSSKAHQARDDVTARKLRHGYFGSPSVVAAVGFGSAAMNDGICA